MSAQLSPIGTLAVPHGASAFEPAELLAAAHRLRDPTYVVQDEAGRVGVAFEASHTNEATKHALLASLPALYPEWLGDRSFSEVHNVRFPYVSGAMANGIATTRLVIAMAKSGFLGFFGAAGLPVERVSKALDELEAALPSESWGSNLIHSPNEPAVEEAVADLYIRRGVRRVSASAYMALTPMIVRYAYHGITKDAQGRIHRKNFVFAKISRPETAKRFLEPAPKEMLDALVAQGKLTKSEAEIAMEIPVAEDFIVESDSGGHTDNQILTSLFPTILALRDQIANERGYRRPIRIGAAGGLGTPTAIAAAFSLGAAFVLTGSVNQACIESGLHESGRKMLAQAGLADVAMAPAADMFELGVEVQVLKRGTMFASRAKKLYELYRKYDGLHAIGDKERADLEKNYLRASFDEAWASTKAFWDKQDPAESARAEKDPKHKMALVFRSYLGLSSKWAIAGDTSRQIDFQIWCGPAMGAFNAWTKGTFLAEPENRSAVQVARNLMEGAAAVTRAQQLRSYGVPMPTAAFDFRPRNLR